MIDSRIDLAANLVTVKQYQFYKYLHQGNALFADGGSPINQASKPCAALCHVSCDVASICTVRIMGK